MGTVYKAACPECGFETELYLGGGFLSVNLKKSANILAEEERCALLELIEEGRTDDFNIESMVTECPACNKFGSRMIIDVTDRDGNVHRFNDKCDECGNKFTVYEDGADGEYSCPACHKGILELLETGLWD